MTVICAWNQTGVTHHDICCAVKEGCYCQAKNHLLHGGRGGERKRETERGREVERKSEIEIFGVCVCVFAGAQRRQHFGGIQ